MRKHSLLSRCPTYKKYKNDDVSDKNTNKILNDFNVLISFVSAIPVSISCKVISKSTVFVLWITNSYSVVMCMLLWLISSALDQVSVMPKTSTTQFRYCTCMLKNGVQNWYVYALKLFPV